MKFVNICCLGTSFSQNLINKGYTSLWALVKVLNLDLGTVLGYLKNAHKGLLQWKFTLIKK